MLSQVIIQLEMAFDKSRRRIEVIKELKTKDYQVSFLFWKPETPSDYNKQYGITYFIWDDSFVELVNND